MFAVYFPSTDFTSEIRDQAVKDRRLFRTRQNPTLIIKLTKIGSTLSPEEHRLHAWADPLFAGFTT